MKALVVLVLLSSSSAVWANDMVVPIEGVSQHVNVRAEADADAEIVGRLKRAESMIVIEAGDDWHKVNVGDDVQGFVSADWTEVLSAEEVAARAVDAGAEAAEDDMDAPVIDDPVAVAPETESQVVADEPAAEEATDEEESTPVAESDSAPAAPVAEGSASEPVAPVAEEPEPEPALPEVKAPPVVAETPAAVSSNPGKLPAEMKGERDYLAKFRSESELRRSQLFDDGNRVGIGTAEPEHRLEVNGSIQIHDQNSSVAGLLITQSDGDTGYIMHNRASTLTIGAGSIDRITIDRDGNVGFGINEVDFPLQMANGAHVTAGGVWTNASSRALKQDIAALSLADATTALTELQPVTFSYRSEADEEYVGFIAEDVPALVAMNGARALSPMDIVAVLTRVVQEQQRRIAVLEASIEKNAR